MSPSDEHLTQSFSDAPEPRVEKLSGAQLEDIAAIPRVESYNSSSQEVSNSIKRRRGDGDTGGTAVKRPRNQTQLVVHITYDKQHKKSLWIVPEGNTYDLLMGVLQSQGGTATTSDGTALDHIKLSLGIKSEDEIEDEGIKNEKSEDEGIKNEKSEDEGIKNEKSEDEGLWDQTLQWVHIAYDEQSKTYLFIVPEGNPHNLLMRELQSQGVPVRKGHGDALDGMKGFLGIESEGESEDEGIKKEKSQDRNENGNEAKENES